MRKIDTKPKEGELIKKDTGRPSSFKVDYLKQLSELVAQGYTVTRICAEWGISRDTYYRWMKENPDFAEASEIGDAAREAWFEQVGIAGMTGQIKGFNATVYLGFMNNKFGWARGGDSGKNTQINIHGDMQVLQNIQQLSNLELDDRIKGLLEGLDEFEGITQDEEGTSTPTSGKGPEEEV